MKPFIATTVIAAVRCAANTPALAGTLDAITDVRRVATRVLHRRAVTKDRVRILISATAIVAMALAGCGGKDGTMTPNPPSAPLPLTAGPVPPLTAPMNLRADGVTARSVRFRWDEVRGATSYEIQMSLAPGSFSSVSVATVSRNSHVFEVLPGTVVYARVRAYRDRQEGRWSRTVTAESTHPPDLVWKIRYPAANDIGLREVAVPATETGRYEFGYQHWDTAYPPNTRVQVWLSVELEARDREGFPLEVAEMLVMRPETTMPSGWRSNIPDHYVDPDAPACVPYLDTPGRGNTIHYPPGGYGLLHVTARVEGWPDSVDVEVSMPGRNTTEPLDLVGWGPSLRHLPRGTYDFYGCNGQRERALRFTGYLWEHWRLPIPVDVVDNWPRLSADEILLQVNDYADRIEERVGFRIITAGRAISVAEFNRERPWQTHRLQIGYRIRECGEGATACAHIASGIASWVRDCGAVTGSDGIMGPLCAVPHEIEHLLGFKHPKRWQEDNWSSDYGVFMYGPSRHKEVEAGQMCFGRASGGRGGDPDFYAWGYSDYNWVWSSGPDTMENLRCIFESQRDNLPLTTSYRRRGGEGPRGPAHAHVTTCNGQSHDIGMPGGAR